MIQGDQIGFMELDKIGSNPVICLLCRLAEFLSHSVRNFCNRCSTVALPPHEAPECIKFDAHVG